MRDKAILGMVVVSTLALLGGIYALTRIEKIPTGTVGVVYTTKSGVKDETLSEGWHFLSPFEHVKEFTVGNEQIVLSKDKKEGSKKDDAFKIATADDANIAISFQMSYRYSPSKVIDTYKKFKGMDGEKIVEQRVKSILKSKISEVTTGYSLMDIYSGNRNEINNKITEYLNSEFNSEFGIEVLDASIVDVHPDKTLQKTIDERVAALQKKQKAKAEQETIKVEAETKLLEAENEAQIKIKQAEAEAKVKIKQAEAEAKANQELARSITSELIKMKEAEARLKHGWVQVQGADAVVTK